MSRPKLPPAESQNIQICTITFNENDRIRLIGLPLEVISAMRNTIIKCWGAIQEGTEYYGAYEFKLKGYPWIGQGQDAVGSRKLLVGVLTTMAQFGWNLIQAADISKKPNDKDTLFFEKGTADHNAKMFAVSFNGRDKIRIIDASSFLPCVLDAIRKYWPPGIQEQYDYCGSKELKLSGNPWWPDGSECVYSRMFLSQVIANIRSRGYQLYGSIDISSDSKGMDLESWVFREVNSAWK